MLPPTPAVLKTLHMAPGPINPVGIADLTDKYGFQYRILTDMLIFAVQIGRFDIAPAVSVLCNFNECPSGVQLQAAKHCMHYLHATISRGRVYWYLTGRECPDLPHGEFTPLHPERSIKSRFPAPPPLEPICIVDVSYERLLPTEKQCSITGIVICLGGTAPPSFPGHASSAPRPSPRRTLRSSPAVILARVSSTGAHCLMIFIWAFSIPPTSMRTMLVRSSLSTTIAPVVVPIISTCSTSRLRNGSNADSCASSRSMVPSTHQMPCQRCPIASFISATSITSRATNIPHMPHIWIGGQTSTKTPPPLVDCVPHLASFSSPQFRFPEFGFHILHVMYLQSVSQCSRTCRVF
jgi:hypothetical protein